MIIERNRRQDKICLAEDRKRRIIFPESNLPKAE
jgi:hypothetical protein